MMRRLWWQFCSRDMEAERRFDMPVWSNASTTKVAEPLTSSSVVVQGNLNTQNSSVFEWSKPEGFGRGNISKDETFASVTRTSRDCCRDVKTTWRKKLILNVAWRSWFSELENVFSEICRASHAPRQCAIWLAQAARAQTSHALTVVHPVDRLSMKITAALQRIMPNELKAKIEWVEGDAWSKGIPLNGLQDLWYVLDHLRVNQDLTGRSQWQCRRF